MSQSLTQNTLPLGEGRKKFNLKLSFTEVVMLLLGFLSVFYINLAGQLYITELVFAVLLPLLLFVRRGNIRVLIQTKLVRQVLLFGALWFLSQVITDIVRMTPAADWRRGWASILFFLLGFFALYLMAYRHVRRLKFFIFGYALGSLVAPHVQFSILFQVAPWKFGYGFAVTLLVLLLISWAAGGDPRRMYRWSPLLALLGLFSIYLNARSLGGAMLLTAFIVLLRGFPGGKTLLSRLHNPLYVIIGGVLLVGGTFGVLSLYGYAAENGYLGEAAMHKYLTQSSGAFGILLGGRTEILSSARAIADSPILGHGSWAKGPQYRLFVYENLNLGYQLSYQEAQRYVENSDLIPAHSHIFQSWVWAGLLGAVFWLVVVGVIFRSFVQTNRFPNSLYTLMVFLGMHSLWDIFFSPFGSIMRVHWMIRLCVFIIAYEQSRVSQKELSTNSSNTFGEGQI